jgi:hypothetical protein
MMEPLVLLLLLLAGVAVVRAAQFFAMRLTRNCVLLLFHHTMFLQNVTSPIETAKGGARD